MEFEFDDDLVALREMVRDFCTEQSAPRATMETDLGYDPKLWRRLGSELGVFGLAVPESLGGDGAGLVHHAVVLEELGAALVCGPVLGTLSLAIPALVALGDKEYLPSLISGARTATLAAPTVHGRFDASAVTVSAVEGRLSGVVTHVPDGDLLLVPANTPDGLALFAVEDAPRMDEFTMDRTRRQATITLDAVPGRLLAADATAILAHAVRTATALLAVTSVGGAQRMLDVTVEHVRSRIQFGQPVGAFQAVKHRCANMLMDVEQARSAAYHAVWALQDDLDDHDLAVSLAKAVASDTYASVSRAAIQLHGGLGFTWEGVPQLYLKRATADLVTFGSGTEHTEKVARLILD